MTYNLPVDEIWMLVFARTLGHSFETIAQALRASVRMVPTAGSIHLVDKNPSIGLHRGLGITAEDVETWFDICEKTSDLVKIFDPKEPLPDGLDKFFVMQLHQKFETCCAYYEKILAGDEEQ